MSRLLPLAAATGLLLAATPASAATLTGTVKVGGKGTAGAQVQLRQAFTTGSRKLAAAKSGKGGDFQLDFTADAAGGPLYVLADGGRKTSGKRTRLMTVLGAPVTAPADAVISEQTTVASAYSLARFLHGRSVSGPQPGLGNAAANAANLSEASTGKVSFVLASSPNGNATETLPKFNTIANALAGCTSGSGRSCRGLFDAARMPNGKRPRNTLAAAQALALYPGQSTGSVYRLAGDETPYAPALDARPNDWTLALVWVGSGLNAPGRMAFDTAGNVWAVNNFQSPGTTAGRELTVLGPAGQPILGSPITGGGLSGAGWGVAIDQAGHVWVANYAGNSISEFGPDGSVISPDSGYDTSLSHPQGLAVDGGGNVWTANFGGDSVVVLRGGNPAAPQTITDPAIANPFSIAIDADGSAWVTSGAESNDGGVVKIANDGTVLDRISGGGLKSPQGISEDFAGNFWVSNLVSDSVTLIKPDGKVAKQSPIRGKSIGGPWGNAVDGDGNVWIAGFHTPALTLLCGADRKACPGKAKTGDLISPKHGYVNEGLQHVTAVQVDPSGNVWAANNWTTGSPLSQFVGGNGLVEFIGAAPPVAAPMIGPPQRP